MKLLSVFICLFFFSACHSSRVVPARISDPNDFTETGDGKITISRLTTMPPVITNSLSVGDTLFVITKSYLSAKKLQKNYNVTIPLTATTKYMVMHKRLYRIKNVDNHFQITDLEGNRLSKSY